MSVGSLVEEAVLDTLVDSDNEGVIVVAESIRPLEARGVTPAERPHGMAGGVSGGRQGRARQDRDRVR